MASAPGAPNGTGAARGPLRVLQVEANEDGTVGGSHQALYDLVRHLDRAHYEPVLLFYQDNRFARQLRDASFEVHLYDRERDRELRIRRHGSRVRKLFDLGGAVARRLRFLREHRIDAVHINNSPLVGNDDWLPAARLHRIPILANAMGDARWAHRSTVTRWLARRFDRVLPISVYMADAMIANGVDPDRLSPIFLGVDLDEIRRRVRRSRDEVRAELGVADHQLLFVMVGNVREWKGQHVALEALARLTPQERSRVHLAFAGAVDDRSRSYNQRLEELERTHRLGDHVSWLGARNDVPDLFAAADLAIHCSIKPEPFGLVVTEAMALGTPVAAARAGGPAEVVTPASGWLHDSARPEELGAILRSVLRDPGELARREEGARARAVEFSVVNTVAGTIAAYDRVMSGASRYQRFR